MDAWQSSQLFNIIKLIFLQKHFSGCLTMFFTAGDPLPFNDITEALTRGVVIQ